VSATTADKLVYMANQIARYFAAQPGEVAAVQTADHLKSYWAPSMRADIVRHLAAGGAGLSPVAAAAVGVLRDAPAGSMRAALAVAGKPSGRAPGDDAG
jgi:formate dehydrogenase subunit delta